MLYGGYRAANSTLGRAMLYDLANAANLANYNRSNIAFGGIPLGEYVGPESRTLGVLSKVGQSLGVSVPRSAVAGESGLIGALEDWEGGVSALVRVAARDAAWEADNAIAIHGNSALSPRTTYLYGLYRNDGSFLKWGITQDLGKRYTKTFMEDKFFRRVASGNRADILKMERDLVETQPGPWNRERWAGSRAGGQP
jgi:hypothetical protein